ncbi:hypothetical protein ASZ78_012201, partial [Callipepla squamata]
NIEERSLSVLEIELGLRRAVYNCLPRFLCEHCKDVTPECMIEMLTLFSLLWKAASLRAAEQRAACTMAAELHFSPPEIPEPTLMENVLHYGLFFGAIFQLICVLAIILPVSKAHKTVSSAL